MSLDEIGKRALMYRRAEMYLDWNTIQQTRHELDLALAEHYGCETVDEVLARRYAEVQAELKKRADAQANPLEGRGGEAAPEPLAVRDAEPVTFRCPFCRDTAFVEGPGAQRGSVTYRRVRPCNCEPAREIRKQIRDGHWIRLNTATWRELETGHKKTKVRDEEIPI